MSKIDRFTLVNRHNPIRTKSNGKSPIQIGNGKFAFGADITGLQTFIPFATMSDWGWKSDDLPEGQTPEMFEGKYLDTAGRKIRYEIPNDQKELSQWLISNPNRLNLARVGLLFKDHEAIEESDLDDCRQELDLFNGSIRSSFDYNGDKCFVTTACDPEDDAIGISLKSDLVTSGNLTLFVEFPYCDGKQKFSAPYVGAWNEHDKHKSEIITHKNDFQSLRHIIGDTTYDILVNVEPGNEYSWRSVGQHKYVLQFQTSIPKISVSLNFGSSEVEWTKTATEVQDRARNYWNDFWLLGGAIDLSKSSDPRWKELERRCILSQYIMAVNASGLFPPQESGLVNNGWYGKFHLEMVFWHCGHLALFNRWDRLSRMIEIYRKFLKSSIVRASEQGYKGARWPKMVDPSGRHSPGEINSLLIWQQPHPIMFAEMEFRAFPTIEVLNKWKEVIFQTAEFMASYAMLDPTTGKYNLGPPMHIMSENTQSQDTKNASFELQYWRFGLSKAILWFQRLESNFPVSWSNVLHNLAPLPVENGLYIICPGIKNMWTEYTWEHPSLVGMYGWLSGEGLDVDIMKRTSKKIWETWHLDKCWGWDFGMLAMNAARCGNGERAIEFLLNSSLEFDDVGLAPGGPTVPFPYLPSNGSFLYAIALMAAGWDGCDSHSRGFPSQGWTVRSEGLSKAL